ncbi:MAG TPA: CHRD domain-containing protein [Geobacteraceae bacterium]
MIRLRYLLLAVAAVLLTASIGFSAEKNTFSAKLSGNEVVPLVKTPAKGDAEFTLTKNGKELTYKLTVTDIENVTAAHIHLGKKWKSGPPVVGLFAGPQKEGKFSGVLAEGVITEKDLMGNLMGKPLTALVKLIKSGGAYVNVHTVGHPDGEIRGQIK